MRVTGVLKAMTEVKTIMMSLRGPEMLITTAEVLEIRNNTASCDNNQTNTKQ
jgi:hypothetical protein